MILAGEVSGDMHAARLVAAIRRGAPDTHFFGIGGDRMEEEEVDILRSVDEMAVMGFTEVLRRFMFFRRVFHEMLMEVKKRKPDAVILVDYPGFNLRFARRVHAMGIKTIYYICPQVWAWNRGRIPKMAQSLDLLITIFPFEKKHFDGTGLRVEFVGHPFVDEAATVMKEHHFALPWKGATKIALLPGSRRHVVYQMLPVMWRAAGLFAQEHPDAGFIVPAASVDIAGLCEHIIRETRGGPANWSVTVGQAREVLRQARAAIVVSGTSTVEAALMKCPMLIAYRMPRTSYLLGRMLVKVDHIGMVNIVAGRRLCPEFIQDDARPDLLAQALGPLVAEGQARAAMLAGFEEVRAALGPGGAEDRAAEAVMSVL